MGGIPFLGGSPIAKFGKLQFWPKIYLSSVIRIWYVRDMWTHALLKSVHLNYLFCPEAFIHFVVKIGTFELPFLSRGFHPFCMPYHMSIRRQTGVDSLNLIMPVLMVYCISWPGLCADNVLLWFGKTEIWTLWTRPSTRSLYLHFVSDLLFQFFE